jgi:hypothetical protein
MAGLVWNWPTSCAWAARVYVSSRAARAHGRAHVGLPSRAAAFDPCAAAAPAPSWWDPSGATPPVLHLVNDERVRTWRAPLRGAPCAREGLPGRRVAALALPAAPKGWPGPAVALTLPSFSGGTPDCPALLRYACRLATRVRVVRAASVTPARGGARDGHPESLSALLSGPALLALSFGNMRMVVDAPTEVEGAAAVPRAGGRGRRAVLLA